jgi:type II secretory pathway predicted ATPase ExeA/cell division septation protein DedD
MPYDGGRVLRHLPGGHDGTTPATASSGLAASLTYEPYYGLHEKPFSLSADPKFLFKSPEHAPAFDELLNGIRRREGLITLTGEIGTGKTTLIRSVLQHLDRRTFSAFVPDPFVSREDLLKMLLVDFGVVSIADLKRGSLNGASRPDLSYPLYEFLDSLVPLQAFAVLIIDEAQNLPLPLLEEIRILSDLEGREKLLQVVLVGQPELRTHLKLPEMRQVDQRVSVRCELTPLGRDGVAGYVACRLRVAGDGQGRVEFSDAAIDAVYQGSLGTPRLINLVCDRALYRGYNARVERIEPSFVWDAIADLGLEPPQPPTSMGRESRRSQPAKPVPAPLESTDAASHEPLLSLQHDRSSSERELLTDFAPERHTDAVSEGIARGWMLVGSATLVAALAAGGMFTYVQLQALNEAPSFTLPPPPQRITPTLDPIVPPAASLATPVVLTPAAPASGAARFSIQVATFETLRGADRLIEELTLNGYRARAVELDYGPPRGRMVQVLVGGYQSAEHAGPDLARLREIPEFADARLERLGPPSEP